MFAIRVVCLLLLLVFGIASSATADDAARRDKIVRVIQMQLDALSRDDAAAAFSHAAPQIRAMFGSPDNFMQMVLADYAVLYQPQSVTFLDQVDVSPTGGIVQRVLVTGPDGSQAIALYTMQQMEDAVWRIAGCVLVPVMGKPT